MTQFDSLYESSGWRWDDPTPTLADLRVAVPRDYRGNEDHFEYRDATWGDILLALLSELKK